MGTATGYLKKLRVQAKKNLAEGEAFLKANAEKENIVVLPSGLQYEVLVASTGKKPTIQHTVSCHYQGTLINGTVFDSSLNHKDNSQ